LQQRQAVRYNLYFTALHKVSAAILHAGMMILIAVVLLKILYKRKQYIWE
jgi:hypothetical protein